MLLRAGRQVNMPNDLRPVSIQDETTFRFDFEKLRGLARGYFRKKEVISSQVLSAFVSLFLKVCGAILEP